MSNNFRKAAFLLLLPTGLVLSVGCDPGNAVVEAAPLTDEQEVEQEELKNDLDTERGATP
ncbi:MAG: hypothetical protein AAFX06_19775 [Planctomycetota bacterium]